MKNITIRSFLLAIALTLSLASFAQNSSVQGYSIPTADRKLSELSADALWDLANTEYANGDYLSALEAYREILNKDIHSAPLYYNLGNVYYKQGKLGLALQHYHKALKLNPGDADTEHNIELVDSQIVDNITPIPQLFFVGWSNYLSSRLSCMEWSVVSLIALALMFAFLLLYLLGESMIRKRIGFGFMVLFIAIFILSTGYAVSARNDLINPNDAILLSISASVKSAPSKSSTEIFKLHEGSKMSIEKSFGEWSEIVIEDGKRGWIENIHLGKI